MNESALSLALARKIGTFALALWLGLSWSAGHAQETCERTGIEFGFFNGVQTQERLAQRVVNTFLPEQYGRTTPDGQPISYTLYYNDSQAGITDFVETFEQRLQEQDGLLAGRFELFFSAMNGGGGWWSRLTEAVPALNSLLGGLFDTFRSYLIRDMTADFGNHNTAQVSQRHREQIDHAATMGKGLLLFAHSQGNLFVNRAYDHALSQVGADSVRVVHVAPASPRATDSHVLANLDLVINGLRTAGAVLPITDPVPGFMTRTIQPDLSDRLDPLAHGLLETYLNRHFEPSARIRRYVEQALKDLRPPPSKPWGDYPDFVPNKWNGGDEPAPEYSDVPPSHSVERIVSSSSQPVVWRYVQWTNMFGGLERSWFRVYVQAEDQGWSSTAYFGRGINGGHECTWGRSPFPGWTSLPWSECRYDRLPLQALSGWLPDEVLDLGDAPVGTEVVLYSQTFTRGVGMRARYVVPVTVNDQTSWQVDFLTGAQPRWSSELQLPETRQITSEPYVMAQSQLLNQGAIDQWRNAREAHESAEMVRYQWYRYHRDFYEQRRQRCEAVVSDPTVPPPTSDGGTEDATPTPCNLPGGPLCTT